MVFWSQNHITFIFIKKMSHAYDLLVQMAYREEKSSRHDNTNIFYLSMVGFKANIAYGAV